MSIVLLSNVEFLSPLGQLVEMLLFMRFVETLLCYRWSSLSRPVLVYNFVNRVVDVYFEQLTALTSYQIFKIRFFSFLRVHLLKLFPGHLKALCDNFNLN